MSGQPRPSAHAWPALTDWPTVERARRIFGLWSADATPFYVFVLRPAPNPEIEAVQSALRDAGIGAVIPPEFLHITVQSLGNIGEGGLTEEIATELGDRIAHALAAVEPFTVALHGANSFRSAAVVEVREAEPSHPLARMQRAVVDTLLAANIVPVRHPDRPYVPHLSICYYDAEYPSRDVADAIAPFRDRRFGDLWVDTVALARMVGDGSLYPTMETVRAIALGARHERAVPPPRGILRA
jgi:2'-5' RNA ligase